MKTRSRKHLHIGIAATQAIVLAASLVLLIITASSAQAASGQISLLTDEGNPLPGDTFDWVAGLLEKTLRREQKVNENLSKLFDKSGQVVTRLEGTITDGQASSRDVSMLEDALKELKGGITTARAAWVQAPDLLANPDGFNKNCQVTDRKVAHETKKELRQVQFGIRKSIGDTLRDALKAIRKYYQDNLINQEVSRPLDEGIPICLVTRNTAV